MSKIKWQTGEPPKNGSYLVETDKAYELDYWFHGTWDDNENSVIRWLPIEGDLVEVVRCKDCKWKNDYGCHNPIWGDGWANYQSPQPRDDAYCSYGERRTEVEE